ncbi:MAG: homocysteine S-methyltransferase family protein [Candidatus Electryonea clarkiae]|nr:homocysteine S-methyltransferase family protein [Candidatus Electryonea clarkiae]MDP8285248.1 homocysteine S-methyltransferase family protein [Candidatus Electryonea clarkiae]
MIPLLDRLQNGEILVSDGALGTELIERGLKPGECPELLNIERPEILEEIARLYLEAGADLIHTNTFGASPLKLADYGLENKTEEINQRAVSSIAKIIGDNAYLVASCGSSGKILQPYGDNEPEEIFESFQRQMKILADAGVEIINIETMIDLQEAILAVKAAKSVATQITVMATMTFDKTPKGYFTAMGTNIAEAVDGLQKAGADIVGSNCGNGLEKMIEIAGEMVKCASCPVIIQSNAGLPEIKDGKLYYAETPEFFAEKTKKLINIGVSIIGGCCGTTPEHIRSIKNVVLKNIK